MITISVRFLRNKYYCFSGLSGWSGAMMRGAIVNARTQELNKLLQDSKSIDDILNICKIHYKDNIGNNLLIYITINSNKYILNHNFKIVTQNEIDKLEFVPFIKYDIKNIRITTIKPIEKTLYYCKNKDEQIEVIKKYIEKANRRFKKWETKPNKIFVYHSYDEEPKEFEIIYDKHIS
jgi:hypothetical protein